MFEGASWDKLEECLECMVFLKSVRMIYAWLESDRFAGNIDRMNEEDYIALVRKFKFTAVSNSKSIAMLNSYTRLQTFFSMTFFNFLGGEGPRVSPWIWIYVAATGVLTIIIQAGLGIYVASKTDQKPVWLAEYHH